MSSDTMADEKVESAREHINEAIKDLSEILVNECPGHNDFSLAFIERMDIAFAELRKIKKMLEKP